MLCKRIDVIKITLQP